MDISVELDIQRLRHVAHTAYERLCRSCATSTTVKQELVLHMGRQAPYEQIFIPAEARIQFYAKPTSRGKNPDHFMLEFNDPAAAEPVKLVVRIVPNSGIKVKRVRGGVKAVAGRLQGAASVLNGTN